MRRIEEVVLVVSPDGYIKHINPAGEKKTAGKQRRNTGQHIEALLTLILGKYCRIPERESYIFDERILPDGQ